MCLNPALLPTVLSGFSFLICEMGTMQGSGVKYLKALASLIVK